ncbi:MAG: alanine--glyoxylate aminotransferase family protein [Chitinophagaceae bacterium]|nr:alanine--glyoxylate aminotransferase family protein [Chitinophagaceae bacterium]
MIYFTPGPSQLYPTVATHIQSALDEGFCSISHRSRRYESIQQMAEENLRALMNIPDHFHIFFTSSATEIWDRCIENLVNQRSFHFVNGSFSERFYTTALQMGRDAVSLEAPLGKGFHDLHEIHMHEDNELICITHNETSTGVVFDHELISGLRKQYPDALIAVDAVSSVPYGKINFSDIDTLFFSVQKGFGLPAGLGVWICNERCIAKAESRKAAGKFIGTYHSLPSFLKHSPKHQTPSTPNMLAIYLLAHVSGDMLHTGLSQIEHDTEHKARLIYDFIENRDGFSPFVKDLRDRSQTVVVVESAISSKTINEFLKPHEMQIGGGYGPLKEQQFRIANFPAVSTADVERLLAALSQEIR